MPKAVGPQTETQPLRELAFQPTSPGLRMTFPGEELDNEFMCKIHESHKITLEPTFPLLEKALIPAQD